MNHRPSEDGLLNFELGANNSPIEESLPAEEVEEQLQAPDDGISTPRMWILSLLFSIFGSSINLFFSLRYPSVSISPIIALLLAHPLGHLWDLVFPEPSSPHVYSNLLSSDDSIRSHSRPTSSHSKMPQNLSWPSLKLWLGQGRFNEKEHCCIYIASNVSFGFAFATDVIVEQTKFYNQEASLVYQILLTLSTQILGYALAGASRRFLVQPTAMVWPGTLVAKAMFTNLHKNENKPANGWTISPYKFFLYVCFGSAAFYLIPGFLMPALSYFSIITWFDPENVLLANLFGVSSGLGLLPITFDWSQIAYIGSPLVVPFWAALNVIGGLIAVMWILAPIMYYTNSLYTSYMPILSSVVFDNTGQVYNVSRVLTENFVFDKVAYEDYSRVFLPATYVVSYALQFAALPALLVHTICWHGKDLWKQSRKSLFEAKERHRKERGSRIITPALSTQNSGFSTRSRTSSVQSSVADLDNFLDDEEVLNIQASMAADVPDWWYIATGLAMAVIGIFVCEAFNVNLPWYGFMLAVGICIVFFIPVGIIQAITNQQSSLYLVSQIICGFVFPGRPVANMVFTTYAYISSMQGLKFASDLKLGQQYMGIPPRLLFKLQLASTVVSSLTQVGILNWALANIPGICTPEALNGFSCPLAQVHFNGSILWGVIGPNRFFGAGQLYAPLVWSFLLGALLPLAVWLLSRARVTRARFWSKINFPLLLGSLSWIPPATALNFSVWAVLCYLFNFRIRRAAPEWWSKYTMTLSAALDSGLAVGVVVVFFALVYPGWTAGFSWWGTEVYKQGCDWKACPYKPVPEGGHFGPQVW